MKKLLSLFGLLGLLAFVATPIYAQEEDDVLGEDQVVVEAENVDADAEDVDVEAEVVDVETEDVDADAEVAEVEDVAAEDVEDEDAYALETSDEDTINLDNIEDFNDIFENEDVRVALDEAGLTNEEAAGLLGGALGLFAGLGIVGIIIVIVWVILTIVAMWKIFTKAGEAGWKSIIPIYNVYIMYKIVGMKNWFWYTLIAVVAASIITVCLGEESSAAGIITLVAYLFNGIVAIVAAYKLPRKFGWGVFASVLYVLFTGICILILGFGNYKYQGKEDKTVVEA